MAPSPGRAPRAALLALSLAAILFAAGDAAAASYLPMAVGVEWQYVDPFEDPNIQAIVDIAHVRGRRAYVKEYTGGLDDGLLNFWIEGTDGSIQLAGYYKPWYPFGLLYEPPIVIFPAQPFVGREWTTHAVAIAIPDNAFYAEFDLFWKVQEQVTVEVPAGSFTCFGVGQVAPPFLRATPQGTMLGIDGRVIAPASGAQDNGPTSATEWYAAGVGLVQYDTGDRIILQSTNVSTPAVTSSWGRIKALYR